MIIYSSAECVLYTIAFIIISVVLVALFFYKYNTWHDRDLNEFDITYRYEDDVKETKVPLAFLETE